MFILQLAIGSFFLYWQSKFIRWTYTQISAQATRITVAKHLTLKLLIVSSINDGGFGLWNLDDSLLNAYKLHILGKFWGLDMRSQIWHWEDVWRGHLSLFSLLSTILNNQLIALNCVQTRITLHINHTWSTIHFNKEHHC